MNKIMTRILIFIITAGMLLMAGGCSDKPAAQNKVKKSTGVNDVADLAGTSGDPRTDTSGDISEDTPDAASDIGGLTGQGITDLQIEDDQSEDFFIEKGQIEDEQAENGQSGSDSSSEGIDVDLTRLSSTMVFAEVYNMVNSPEDYVGKTVRIRGLYYASYYEETDKYYHCVIIADATACCQSGIEFVWDDDTHAYPEEYPANDEEVEITGIFGTYEEFGQSYMYLATDDITIVN